MKAKKKAKRLYKLLRELTQGQGCVGVQVFDAGAGGGFVKGELVIELLRDGKYLKKKVHSVKKEFIGLLTWAFETLTDCDEKEKKDKKARNAD